MEIKKVILDTDIGPDCDDVAALAMLNLYQKQGKVKILGIAHCTSNPYGAGTIDAVCRYYGHKDIPVSTYPGRGFLDSEEAKKYNRYMTTHLENRYQTSQPEDAAAMYRRILSEEEDKSVEVIAIGPLNNLSDLLSSSADQYSPLSGEELVRQKVSRLVIMGGIFHSPYPGIEEEVAEKHGAPIDDYREFNIKCDVRAAQKVATFWPTKKIYLGFEAGLVETGHLLASCVPEDHPVRLAYQLYTKHGIRESWDLLTVEYAVESDCPHYRLSEEGSILFDHEGRTLYRAGEGIDQYVIWNQDKEIIAAYINQLLITMP